MNPHHVCVHLIHHGEDIVLIACHLDLNLPVMCFNKKMKRLLDTYMIADDMIIAARTSEEHNQILHQVMETARAKNIKFNKEKSQFKVDSVKYMGHIVTAQGVKVDEEKVKAIREMPPPCDRQGVLRFLGSVQYLSKYIPREAELTAPLRNLLKKNVLFQWMPEHQKAFEVVKQQLCQAPLLQYFDVKKSVLVQADASKDGLGACLLQEGKPVTYASRSFSLSEQNYAQIEKELLAVLYAMRKLHQYVFGKVVLVQTDHKPLEVIFKKSIGSAPARLQHVLLQLQRYQLDIVYTPGRQMYLADTLSRAAVDPPKNDEEQLEGERVIHKLSAVAMHSEGVSAIQEATSHDNQLQAVVALIRQGWPQYMKDVPLLVKPFWPMKDLMRYEDGIIYVDERIVIPLSKKREILLQLHESHQGVQRTRARAKEIVYWPGMGNDIETTVGNCSICAHYASGNQKEPLIPHEIPKLPWGKVGIDIFEYGSLPFLLVVDYYSKYPKVLSLPDKTAGAVINRLKAVFARHGIPRRIVSDNMPFAGREFRQFAQEWGFEQCFSSPGYPQSNGMAERAICSIKQLIRKAEDTQVDLYMALLEYRNTPVTGMEYSPAQMLMGRMLRSKLPVTTDLLCPKIPHGIYEGLQRVQKRQKYFYDQTAKSLKPLKEGDEVWVENKEGWFPAVVTKNGDQPCTYRVMMSEGRSYWRNRRKLRYRRRNEEENDMREDIVQSMPIVAQHDQLSNMSNGSMEEAKSRNDVVDKTQVVQSEERSPRYITSYGRCVFSPERYIPG
ncbi:uncharacterized protein K02A2.6-like isoform X1 [Hemicordylus capensis]|uniref:uncharacterized protein K02A2.6-like isoform X1 n=1 Tax=Hemicordylus capensis TaxID=884348 RepID=UPI00230386F8|nr:uncharacterized protein K02A2.6-like isoform X1 [Hemicordylus capensis]XP_053154029.1 uncharacterized protein K02A2.6-like isoform X1 [Hemicordylus capensis]XP_053154031.1 uncharacterized protein K02A2.6-like isoform X1 [Hemicordylus capensis]XP_053154032.1 uncharacterized protein K02A2.6-like isoform X1 [Hemicordylus capensis]XP_053154033.1 uncharacterized protein K02A2.6-like isoform X1 [Hemicordylus capensis]